jgi:hypothetical protein
MKWVWIPVVLLVGCTHLGPGYQAVTVTIQTGDKTGKLLAAGCRAKKTSCVKDHGQDRGKLAACLDTCVRALKAWTEVARPAINSAAAATFAGLEIARASKSKVDWIHLIKPAACALAKIFKQFSPLLGADKVGELSAGLKFVELATCPN